MIVFVVNHISAERAAIGNPSSYTDFHHNSPRKIYPFFRKGVHVVAKFVGGEPKSGFKAERGSVGERFFCSVQS
jgi:hypothetical protein